MADRRSKAKEETGAGLVALAQGAGAQNKIRAARLALTRLEAFRLQQPWWLPYRGYRWLAERRASRFLAGCREIESLTRRADLVGVRVHRYPWAFRFCAVRARPWLVVSSRMLLRMGRVVRVEIARDTVCSAWPRVLGWQVTLKAGSLSPLEIFCL